MQKCKQMEDLPEISDIAGSSWAEEAWKVSIHCMVLQRKEGINMGSFHCRLGGSFGGWDLALHYDGSRIIGRMGGSLMGKDVRLDLTDQRAFGRIGGKLDGKDLEFMLTDSKLEGRVGGRFGGADIMVRADAEEIAGRVGGDVLGNDVQLRFNLGRVSGRVGGSTLGADVVGDIEDFPRLLAAGLVGAAQWMYEQQHNRSSARS
jgi:hypothetical protein